MSFAIHALSLQMQFIRDTPEMATFALNNQ